MCRQKKNKKKNPYVVLLLFREKNAKILIVAAESVVVVWRVTCCRRALSSSRNIFQRLPIPTGNLNPNKYTTRARKARIKIVNWFFIYFFFFLSVPSVVTCAGKIKKKINTNITRLVRRAPLLNSEVNQRRKLQQFRARTRVFLRTFRIMIVWARNTVRNEFRRYKTVRVFKNIGFFELMINIFW